MPSTRRAFLTACGIAATAGCAARSRTTPQYQLVAGVEWKTIRGTRDNSVTKIAQNRPTSGPVGETAPREVDLRTTSYDDAVGDLAGNGSLVLTDRLIERINTAYADPYAVIVLTVYNEDPYNDIPIGNSHGYRATFEQFNRIDPGNRIAVTLDRDSDVPAINELLTVDAGETDSTS